MTNKTQGFDEAAEDIFAANEEERLLEAVTTNNTQGDLLPVSQLTRPIMGIENRTALEVFDIMCGRIRLAAQSQQAAQPDPVGEALQPLIRQFPHDLASRRDDEDWTFDLSVPEMWAIHVALSSAPVDQEGGA